MFFVVVALSTHSMDFLVALSTMTWIYVCALEHTQKSMLWYLEQQTYPYNSEYEYGEQI